MVLNMLGGEESIDRIPVIEQIIVLEKLLGCSHVQTVIEIIDPNALNVVMVKPGTPRHRIQPPLPELVIDQDAGRGCEIDIAHRTRDRSYV